MERRKLRHGYSTGACAAAAAKGAARMLREGRSLDRIALLLPNGEKAEFALHGCRFDDTSASCFVVKDAGDDPDVTNGAEIHAEVRRRGLGAPAKTMVFVHGGEGVGKVTKPGLAVGVGEPAINPVPLRMIRENVAAEFSVVCLPQELHVTISVPNGRELAKRTLNERLGIVGGISILGTTGIVRPLSAEAWTATIDSGIDVALACGCRTVVLSTGRASELATQRYFGTGYSGLGTRESATFAGCASRGDDAGCAGELKLPVPSPESRVPAVLPDEAYVMMGDHVSYALESCARKGVPRVALAAQFAKLVKIAAGHPNTHAASSGMDLGELRGWIAACSGAGRLLPLLDHANTARQVLEESGNDPLLLRIVAERVLARMAAVLPQAEVQVFVAGYDGGMLYIG